MKNAGLPDTLRPRTSQTALPRPTTASAPLSKYLNGPAAPGLPSLMPSATWRACWIATVARPGSGRSPGPGALATSPITEISGWPSIARSGPTGIRPPRSCVAPVAAASVAANSAAWTPAPQITVRVAIRCDAPSSSNVTPSPSISVTRAPWRTSTPSSARYFATLPDSRSLNAATGRGAGVEQDHARLARVVAAVLAVQVVAAQDRQRPGDLDAGRPPADDHERHVRRAIVVAVEALGLLEAAVDAVAQPHGVVERLQAVGRRRPTRRGRSTTSAPRTRRSGCRTAGARRRRA